jgi:beta-galactosidase
MTSFFFLRFARLAAIVSLLCLTSLTAAYANSITLPDGGWRLWPDTKAAWQSDTVYLPDDVHLDQLPTNPPTSGWAALTVGQGIPVTLPSTVEQHFWGKFGLRPYNSGEYIYADSDPQVKNGNYLGVSWWWRPLAVPASFTGKTVILHVRGARMRAEVYLNQKLVGYSLMEETGFDCDVTKAIKPGQVNQLAIRITNPGGRMEWGDWMSYTWGKTTFHPGHGFGGLDRGLTLTAHDSVYVADAWALNTPQVRTVRAYMRLHNGTGQIVSGTVRVSVVDPKRGVTLAVKALPVTIAAGADQTVQSDIACPQAQLWDLKTPRLYRLHTEWVGAKTTDAYNVTFGFRWFAPEGVGKEATLRLNGQRIRVFSAISWGFWGLNGLWPTPALAVKEVTQAKRLGLNCLNFHRNIGKAEVLDVQDRLGLLRYMEPGNGQMAIGNHKPGDSPEATGSAEKYMEEKILRMIRDSRSHPSLVVYVVQNEANFDLKNPRVFALLRKMHAEDPSRTIVLKSGIETKGEAWMKPYDGAVYADQGDGYSGWSDSHTVGYPDGTWNDNDYHSPDDYVYRNTNAKEIVDYGEMGGSGTPDNHALMVAQIKTLGGSSYDLQDHQEILDAYNTFLDKWGFRQAFPTAQGLLFSIGNKQYDYWSNVIEAARLSDTSDYLTLSGWESTAIENHSGLVDALRNFHGDPALIRDRLAPLLPVAKPRHTVLRVGEADAVDLYLLNETNLPTHGPLRLTLTDPLGKVTSLGVYPNPAFQKDKFVYPIQANVATPLLTQAGVYHLTFANTDARQVRTLRVIAPPRTLGPMHIGVLGGPGLLGELNALGGVTAEPYQADRSYDLAVVSGGTPGSTYSTSDAIQKTDDPKLYQTQRYGKLDSLDFLLPGLPPGPAIVTLYFAETYQTKPGARKFDIVVNGQTVLHDFDIYAESGGKDIALQKTFTVDAPLGTVEVRAGSIAADNAQFAAIKAEAGGKTVAVYFGDSAYTDKSGLTWQPYQSPSGLSAALLARVRGGLPLLIDTPDDRDADADAQKLAAAGAFHYDGLVGSSRAPWMGSWYFVRAHPVYDGLPVNETMHGDYQVGTGGANGLRVDGPGVQIIAAYSRDHDRNIGAGTFTAPLGLGTILFHCVPPMHPAIRARWLANALAYLAATAPKERAVP